MAHDKYGPVDAYPLTWPAGWPRTPASKRVWALPGGSGTTIFWDRVVSRLMTEVQRLGASHVVLSSNQPLRRDGRPYATRRQIEDPGVALYFRLTDRDCGMAQDRYRLLIDNIRSLALAIAGLRQMERHGGGHMMERAFQGFAVLPPPRNGMRSWREVLGLSDGWRPTVADIEQAYRRRAKQCHPDAGGSHESMAELNAALEQARTEVRN